MTTRILALVGVFVLGLGIPARAQVQPKIPAGSKIYIAPMDGFETYLAAGLQQKKVPVVVVADRERADYEITGSPDVEKVEGTKGWAKVAEIGLTRSHTGDYITVRGSWMVKVVQSGELAFAYAVEKQGSHPQQSAAEAFAKHLKDQMAGK